MTTELLSELLSKQVAGLEIALIQIGLGRDAKDGAQILRAHLIDLLSLLDRNTGLG